MNDVRDYYNTHFEEEHDRLGYKGSELQVTLHFIKKYLPPGSEIFDTACGTGHYARELLEEANLEPLHLAGAEGIFGERFDLFHQLDGTLKEAWLAFVINHCEEKEMVFNSKHLLSVSAKKVRK